MAINKLNLSGYTAPSPVTELITNNDDNRMVEHGNELSAKYALKNQLETPSERPLDLSAIFSKEDHCQPIDYSLKSQRPGHTLGVSNRPIEQEMSRDTTEQYSRQKLTPKEESSTSAQNSPWFCPISPQPYQAVHPPSSPRSGTLSSDSLSAIALSLSGKEFSPRRPKHETSTLKRKLDPVFVDTTSYSLSSPSNSFSQLESTSLETSLAPNSNDSPSPRSLLTQSPVMDKSEDAHMKPKDVLHDKSLEKKRPQPVPQQKKTVEYYRKRMKNNLAAKKSRNLRRQNEIDTEQKITPQVLDLEEENRNLRDIKRDMVQSVLQRQALLRRIDASPVKRE